MKRQFERRYPASKESRTSPERRGTDRLTAGRTAALRLFSFLIAMSPAEAFAAQPIEHESAQEKMTAIKEALVHPIDPHIEQTIIQEVGQEDYDAYKEAVACYPLEAVLNDLGQKSGLTQEELLRHENLTVTFPYTDSVATDTTQRVEQELANSTSTDPQTKAALADISLRSEDLHTAGGISFENTIIGINLGYIHRSINTEHLHQNSAALTDGNAEQRKRYLHTYIQYIITHELMHTLVPDEYGAYDRGDINHALVEGLADATAMLLMPNIEKDPTYYPGSYEGYTHGERQAARFLLVSLDAGQVIQDNIKGDFRDIGKQFDAKYGAGQWQRVVDYRLPIPDSDKTSQMTSLYAMLQETVATDGPDVIKK